MISWLRLFRQFILRPLLRQRARTGLAVLGFALGVAVMIAVRLANRSVTDSFRTAVDAVSGEASLRLRGLAGRFDEQLLARLRGLERFGTVSPVIEADARVVASGGGSSLTKPARGDVLHVLGVDALLDTAIRQYRLLRTSAEDRPPTAPELLRLLTEPDAIVLTERFARRTGRAIGEPISLVFDSTPRTFRIRGLLRDEGPARSLDGNFALLDIAAAQWATDRLGRLDYADVKLRPEADTPATRDAIRRQLPDGLRIEAPAAESARAATMVDAFHFNLTALSGIALLVGLFLVYNTISISVAARQDEIGMLQAVGAGRATVVTLFLGEALLIAALGTAGGLVLGPWLARTAVVATADTVETFFIAQAAQHSAARLAVRGSEIALAVGLTLPLALAAAAVPAWRAASVRPVEVIGGAGRLVRAFRSPRRHLGKALVLLAAGWGCTRIGPIGDRPVFGFVAELLLTLGAALLVPGLLWLVCRLIRGRLTGGTGPDGERPERDPSGWPLSLKLRVAEFVRIRGCFGRASDHRSLRILTNSATLRPNAQLQRPPSVWRGGLQLPWQLAASNLLGALSRVSISVAALAVSLAMMVAVAVMVSSFRETVVYWLDSTLRADLFVRPAKLTSAVGEARVARQTVAAIRRDPDVAATGWIATRQVPFGPRAIRVASTDLTTMLRQRILLFKAPHDAEAAVRRAIPQDGVLVSESFSLRFGTQPGDQFLLPTPHGLQPATVAAVYYDYASNQGTVLMDGAAFRRWFGEDTAAAPSSLGIYLRPGADPETVRARLARVAGAQQDLYFATNDNVRREAMRIFDSTFTITYALEVIAIVIAGLGVISTLLTLLYERQREMALLALVGATPGQVRRMIVIEAVLIGAVSQLFGILLGLAMALVLIYVVNVQSFGWTIQFHFPAVFVLQSTVCLLAATALWGLYPAARAAQIRAIEIVREE